jgi:DNA-binding LacI/PurR family transcriptional regulator
MSMFSTPSLTTLAVDREKIGSTLARLMIERLANPRKPFTLDVIGTELKVRQSTRRLENVAGVSA